MKWLTETDLARIYDKAPAPAATQKVADRMTPEYARFLDAARFCVLATVGPEGTDASPRGDDGPVVRVLDAQHVALPDWQGNNRINSIRNIARDGRVSLMFLIRGSGNAIRINGRARLTDDAQLLADFARGGKSPRCVIVVQIDDLYFQCARAIMRSELWADVDDSGGLPSAGQILAAMTKGRVGGPDYDREWPQRAAQTMW